MDRIKEVKIGKREGLRFTSFNNIEGNFSFDDSGFSFDKQIGQENIINLPFSSTLSVDCARGNLFSVTLTDNCSVSLKNALPGAYAIKFIQDTTGGRTVTFPNSGYYVESDNGAPDLSGAAASQIDIIYLLYDGEAFHITQISNLVEIGSL